MREKFKGIWDKKRKIWWKCFWILILMSYYITVGSFIERKGKKNSWTLTGQKRNRLIKKNRFFRISINCLPTLDLKPFQPSLSNQVIEITKLSLQPFSISRPSSKSHKIIESKQISFSGRQIANENKAMFFFTRSQNKPLNVEERKKKTLNDLELTISPKKVKKNIRCFRFTPRDQPHTPSSSIENEKKTKSTLSFIWIHEWLIYVLLT